MTARSMHDADCLLSLHHQKASRNTYEPLSADSADCEYVEELRLATQETLLEMRQYIRHHRRENLFTQGYFYRNMALRHYALTMAANNTTHLAILRHAEGLRWVKLPTPEQIRLWEGNNQQESEVAADTLHSCECRYLPDKAEKPTIENHQRVRLDEYVNGFWLGEHEDEI
ncbi:hypothetical protein BGW36DRAFT_356318 [Talaromyces proteolyticus]|uniref:Uncharacterized protein n=1 Tax=Talaromyces proteolyticus TaxID=1131652 RepID=A0AAD4KZ32_9EURO|nr:uncharacterized protein BGW36DRAFT_356318 [Talaromyces proteolyticus]KAH8702182.1 hypothetical protein BGW36DRAFT_356318 [Talaromyces proteolyticus]